MKEVRRCKACQKLFIAQRSNAAYCSSECRVIGKRMEDNKRQRQYREEERQFKDANNPKEGVKEAGFMSIAEIDAAAKKVGLSYGKYVAEMKIK